MIALRATATALRACAGLARIMLARCAFACCALVGLALAGPGCASSPARAAETPEASVFLMVAAPELHDPNFSQTVVLVARTETGSVGLVLNRPSPRRMAEFFRDRDSLQKREDQLWFGGPVPGAGMSFLVLTTPEDPVPDGASVLLPGVIATSDVNALEAMLARHPRAPMRAFAGFASWAPGQLEEEVNGGSWFVLRADLDVIFSIRTDTLWADMLKRARKVDAQALLDGAVGGRERVVARGDRGQLHPPVDVPR